MKKTSWSFSDAQFNNIFPFYILLNEQLQITSCGPSLHKIFANLTGASFFDFFNLISFHNASNSFEELKTETERLVVLEARNNLSIKLRGQLKFFANENKILFIGSPWFSSMDEVKAIHLSISDFAIHDSMIDLLHVLKAQELTTNDLKELLNKLQIQKRELTVLSKIAEENINAVIITNKEGDITWVNKSFCQITGFTMEESFGRKISELLYGPESDKDVKKYLNDSLINGNSFHAEILNYTKSKKIFWTRIQGQPIYNKGEHTGFFAIQEDITQEKEIKIRIESSERELSIRLKQIESIAENSPGVIYEYEYRKDGTEGFIYLSPAIEKIFGISAAAYIANSEFFIHPDDLDNYRKKNERCRLTLEPFNDESRLVVPDKGVIWRAISSSFSYATEKGNVYTGFMQDITEKKKVEESLRAEEEKYRSIIENMKLGLLEVDLKECITYANESFCEMSGYGYDELIGKNPHILFNTHKLSENLPGKNTLRKKGISDAFEIAVMNRSGELKWWFVSGAPRYNNKGIVTGSVGIHLDITYQKQMQRDLIESRERAEQLARTKDIFLANMSHEIRTPLNAVQGLSEQLSKTSLDRQQAFFISTIRSAADHLLVIINDILDMSKIDAGKLTLDKTGFRLAELINRSIQVLYLKAQEKGILLSLIYLDPKIPDILIGDPHRLKQILLNIISNGVNFTEKGSVDVSVEVLEKNNIEAVIRFTITDTGIGMNETFIKNIFENFSQENTTLTRKKGGSGLGMGISKSLIELMKGEIMITSKQGAGTEVYFDIPFAIGKESDLPSVERITVNTNVNILENLSVLVVDDNEINSLVASTILENYKMNVINATNGYDAIEQVKNRHVDIILMDIQMPEMDGYQATAVIRNDLNFTRPIIALTANAIKGENEKCIAAGMNDYLSKPFKEKDLVNIITKWVERSSDTSVHKLYDLTKMKEISKGDNDFIKKMLSIFITQTPDVIGEMKKAIQINDKVTLGKLAHKIKPGLDSFGISSLHYTIRELETAADKSITNERIWELMNTTEAVITEVINDFTQLLK